MLLSPKSRLEHRTKTFSLALRPPPAAKGPLVPSGKRLCEGGIAPDHLLQVLKSHKEVEKGAEGGIFHDWPGVIDHRAPPSFAVASAAASGPLALRPSSTSRLTASARLGMRLANRKSSIRSTSSQGTRIAPRSALATMALIVRAVIRGSKCAEYAGGISGASLAADAYFAAAAWRGWLRVDRFASRAISSLTSSMTIKASDLRSAVARAVSHSTTSGASRRPTDFVGAIKSS
jgi:hypothetical protein